MRLTNEEKHVIEKISVASGKDRSIVKDVLKGMLFTSIIEIFGQFNEDENKLIIPYIGTLNLDWYSCSDNPKSLKISAEFDVAEALSDELRKINSGDTTPSKEFIKKKIYKSIMNMVDAHENNEVF